MNQFTMPPITPVPFNGLMAFAWVGIFLIIGMLLKVLPRYIYNMMGKM